MRSRHSYPVGKDTDKQVCRCHPAVGKWGHSSFSVSPDDEENENEECPHFSPWGFTLIELLVVIAVISVLLAIMLPTLRRVRVFGYRTGCASQLRQIAFAWHTYLASNDQQFLQAVNANHYFGGWSGMIGGPAARPLNRYAGLPAEPNGPNQARLFRCPADQGDDDYGPVAYLCFGNSYQTNLMLIGPDSLPSFQGMPERMRELNGRINEHLPNLKANAVCDPARLLLVGDNNWVTQWDPLIPVAGRTWHGKKEHHNLAFFDGHTALVNIHKGLYLDSDYRVQPFRELDSVAGGVLN